MFIINVLITAVALSMDAMSLSILNGIYFKNNKILLKTSLTFGFFQFLMSLVGFLSGNLFINKLFSYFNYISFFIFIFLGIMMLKEGIKKSNRNVECSNREINFYTLILMGIATSIDSLLVGFTFSLLPSFTVFSYCLIIGSITFLFSAAGFIIGSKFGSILGNSANLIGGILLICIGISIFIK